MDGKVTRMKMLGGLAGLAASVGLRAERSDAAEPEKYAVSHSDAEWRKELTADQYAVLRKHATEPAFSSPLDEEHRPGTYVCAGCAERLFDARTKFESGSGWPSFYQALPHAVETSQDRSLFMERTEVHCSRCGGHLGHVFDDGPKPTGLRYCMNGTALRFEPNG